MSKSLILALAIASTSSVYAEVDSPWGYSGHEGPDNWASLTADNFVCTGKNQSPINLTGFIKAELKPIKFSYQAGGNEVVNNGHTIQVNYEQGSRIELDGQIFNLLQVHFHAPSENHINGHSYPLEAHFVHASKQGELAVVAVMYEGGIPKTVLEVHTDEFRDKVVVAVMSPQNKMLEEIWKVMPTTAGATHALKNRVNIDKLLPKHRDYYRFNGSLTTPPCSEGVRWLVMKDVVTISKEQINTFEAVLHEPNNRPLQSLNARSILQ
ncbi:MAG: carbonic anhydrase [Methylococcaceae bacterium]|nr:carbonic anhydrase [Methylococcaceae bacterium]